MDRDWRSGASPEILRLRADTLRDLRNFFDQRCVLEVDTPVLLSSAVSEVHLHSYATQGDPPRYLHTSPEFAMKRLLASGSGPIYQFCKCFRRDEQSARHNPEFTMLEWYRPGFDLPALEAEVSELVDAVLGAANYQHASYAELFQQHMGINPHRSSKHELQRVAQERLDLQTGEMGKSDWLDLIMSHLIEPQLQGRVWVTGFPRQQAGLSRVAHDAQGEVVAQRSELFIDGMEIANAYHELSDALELQRRAEDDNVQRRSRGLPEVALDTHLLAAHRHGLPECAGVALGFDRLLMLKSGSDRIDQVLAFAEGRI